jgi:hypothetical protein
VLSEALSAAGKEHFASGSGLRARRPPASGEPSTEDEDMGMEEGGESSTDII